MEQPDAAEADVEQVDRARLRELEEKERVSERLQSLLDLLPGGVVVLEAFPVSSYVSAQVFGQPIEPTEMIFGFGAAALLCIVATIAPIAIAQRRLDIGDEQFRVIACIEPVAEVENHRDRFVDGVRVGQEDIQAIRFERLDILFAILFAVGDD